MNIRADKIFMLLIILITVKQETCLLTVFKIRLTRTKLICAREIFLLLFCGSYTYIGITISSNEQ